MVGKEFPIRRGHSLQVTSSQQESIHKFSLCFENSELEEEYRKYQFQLVRHSMLGRFGTCPLVHDVLVRTLHPIVCVCIQ